MMSFIMEWGPLIVGSFPIWGCILFAWWLSDGFKNVKIGGGGYKPGVGGVDPYTGGSCTVYTDRTGIQTVVRH